MECYASIPTVRMTYRARARDARSRVMPAEHQNTLTQRRGCCNAHNSYYREIPSGVIAPMILNSLYYLYLCGRLIGRPRLFILGGVA
jgi:hypothetical protein